MKKLSLVLVCCLAFVLTACPGGGGVTGENASKFSGTALNADGKAYTGGAGTLFINVGTTQTKVGTIDATGKFTVSLPSIADKDLISGFLGNLQNGKCKDLITEGKDARFYNLTFIVIKGSDGKLVGNLVQVSNPNREPLGNITAIQRIYFDNRLVVKGTCQPDTATTNNIDIVFNKGWNAAFIAQSVNAGKMTISLTTPAALPNVNFYVVGDLTGTQ